MCLASISNQENALWTHPQASLMEPMPHLLPRCLQVFVKLTNSNQHAMFPQYLELNSKRTITFLLRLYAFPQPSVPGKHLVSGHQLLLTDFSVTFTCYDPNRKFYSKICISITQPSSWAGKPEQVRGKECNNTITNVHDHQLVP